MGVWSDTDTKHSINVTSKLTRNNSMKMQSMHVCACAGVFDTYVVCAPSHTPVPYHAIETDKSVCIIHSRSSTKENAHCNGHTDDQNTKEEEVYHDLCAIHRATRSQVLFFCCTPF